MLVESVLLLTVFGFPCYRAEEAPESSQSAPKSDIVINDNDIRDAFRKWHNALRVRVAQGRYLNEGPASNMYRLFPSTFLEWLAMLVLNKTEVNALFFGSNNYAVNELFFGSNNYTRKIPSGTRLSDEAIKAVQQWSKTTHTFNQMILAEATFIGCSYQLSNTDEEEGSTTLEMLCLYDKKYRQGTPYTKGPYCRKDSDCTTYTLSTCFTRLGICEREDIS